MRALLLLLTLGLPAAALAEDIVIGGEPTPPAYAPLQSEEAIDERTQTLASGLRCPVCQGLSVNDSSSPAALNMKGRIRELVAQGYADDQIEAFFIDRYGTFILLDPPDEGVNRLLHLAPGLGLLLGAAVVVLVARQQLAKGAPEPPRKNPESMATELAPASLDVDPYAKRVLEELEEP